MMTDTSMVITENSEVADARRQITSHARTLGFDETQVGTLAILTIEMAGNIVKHGGGGEMIVHTMEAAGKYGIQLLALDKGPGMHDVDACVRDGYSTAGSPGTGLGAIVRMSDEARIYSVPGFGTVVMARLWVDGPPAGNTSRLDVQGISVPKRGEIECGDGWANSLQEERSVIMVVDGLGHGPLAASASRTAIEVFHDNADREAARIISIMHDALRSTRGAAVAITEIDHRNRSVRFAGIGNIAAIIFAPEKTQRMVSHNGIVGHEMRKVQEFLYPWPEDALLMMHSDGISTHWSPDTYPGLLHSHPSLVAGVIYRDFCRGRDDATVVAAIDQEAWR